MTRAKHDARFVAVEILDRPVMEVK